MPTNYYAGKAAALSHNGATKSLSNWTITVKTEAVDVTNFDSGGYNENIAGLSSADCTYSGPYSDSPMGFTQGNSVTAIFKVSGAVTFTATVRVTAVKLSTDVKGAAQVEVTAVSNGVFAIAI